MGRGVVQRIIPVEAGENADTRARGEGGSPAGVRASQAGHQRGRKRAEQVGTGETRELGRAHRLLVRITGRRGVAGDQEPWGERSASAPAASRRGTQREEADKVAGSERTRSDPRRTGGRLSGAQDRGRWGSEAQATHWREGDAGHTVRRGGQMGDTVRSPTLATQLQRIAEQARYYPEMVFPTFAHLIDGEFLREAYYRTRKDSAPGIEGGRRSSMPSTWKRTCATCTGGCAAGGIKRRR